eukprot:sb/3472662/
MFHPRLTPHLSPSQIGVVSDSLHADKLSTAGKTYSTVDLTKELFSQLSKDDINFLITFYQKDFFLFGYGTDVNDEHFPFPAISQTITTRVWLSGQCSDHSSRARIGSGQCSDRSLRLLLCSDGVGGARQSQTTNDQLVPSHILKLCHRETARKQVSPLPFPP